MPSNTIPNDFTLMSASADSLDKMKTNDPRKIKGLKVKAWAGSKGDQAGCAICGEWSKTFPTMKGLKLWKKLHMKGKHPEYL